MLLRAFRKAEDGVAAVEFALILPLMITMFFGVVEITRALLARADVSAMAGTAADLISQEKAATNTDLSNVYAAAGTILYPNTGTPTIRITSVIYDPSNPSTTSGKIDWTCTQAGSAPLNPASRAKNDTVTFGPPLIANSQPLMTANSSVIIAEVAYSYASPTTKIITGSITMANNFVTKPRRVAQITAPSSCT